jgi:DNA-binding IclR family transcriptional regulator
MILFKSPVVSIATLVQALDKSYNTTASILETLTALGIVEEVSEQKRNKLWVFKEYLAMLEQEYPLDTKEFI